MKRIAAATVAFFAVSFVAIAPPPGESYLEAGFGFEAIAAEGDPAAVIRGIYEQFSPDNYPDNLQASYFSESLFALWREVEEGAGDDFEYAVDFDIFLNAQDTDSAADLATEVIETSGNNAKVKLNFSAFGEPREFLFDMVDAPDGWKIDNMSWGAGGPDLRALLEDLKERQASR